MFGREHRFPILFQVFPLGGLLEAQCHAVSFLIHTDHAQGDDLSGMENIPRMDDGAIVQFRYVDQPLNCLVANDAGKSAPLGEARDLPFDQLSLPVSILDGCPWVGL